MTLTIINPKTLLNSPLVGKFHMGLRFLIAKLGIVFFLMGSECKGGETTQSKFLGFQFLLEGANLYQTFVLTKFSQHYLPCCSNGLQGDQATFKYVAFLLGNNSDLQHKKSQAPIWKPGKYCTQLAKVHSQVKTTINLLSWTFYKLRALFLSRKSIAFQLETANPNFGFATNVRNVVNLSVQDNGHGADFETLQNTALWKRFFGPTWSST